MIIDYIAKAKKLFFKVKIYAALIASMLNGCPVLIS